MGRTKAGGQKHSLDKWYTKLEIVDLCLSFLKFEEYDLIIEPSAGNGSFSLKIPNALAFDLEPEHKSITKKDWFTYHSNRSKKILVIGNPPFGQQGSLAMKFLKHSMEFADTIAFILPKSFMKESIKKRIRRDYKLEKEIELPVNAFTLNNQDKQLPTVFQIWRYSENPSRKETDTFESNEFEFVEKSDANLAFRRVGGTAGSISTGISDKSESTHYFLKCDKPEELFKIIKNLEFKTKNYGVGPRSISRQELLKELYEAGSNFSKIVKTSKNLFDF